MLITNNNKTVTFENREEFNRYFNMYDLTLLGYPALFNFETNDSLTFTLVHGMIAVQDLKLHRRKGEINNVTR